MTSYYEKLARIEERLKEMDRECQHTRVPCCTDLRLLVGWARWSVKYIEADLMDDCEDMAALYSLDRLCAVLGLEEE